MLFRAGKTVTGSVTGEEKTVKKQKLKGKVPKVGFGSLTL